MRPFLVENFDEVIEPSLLLKEVLHRGLRGLFLQREMHAFVTPVLLRVARFDPLDADSQPEPPHRELAQVKESVGRSKRNTVIAAAVRRQAAFFKKPFKYGKSKVFPRRRKHFATEQVAAGMIGDRQRITILAVAQQKLAFVIGAPELVGSLTCRQSGSLRTSSCAARTLHQAVAIQYRMNRALGRNGDTRESADQAFANFASTPTGYSRFTFRMKFST